MPAHALPALRVEFLPRIRYTATVRTETLTTEETTGTGAEESGLPLFSELGIDDAVLKAVEAKGFTAPTPIQVLVIPRLLEGEANVIARARTGTGKTAAFALPLVQELRAGSGHPRALVLVPTRELAIQVAAEIDSFRTDEFPRTAVVYGGSSIVAQLRALKAGTEIVVGTPGRILDHLNRHSLDLSHIEYFILDEADEMLDMGFIEDIETIFGAANPEARVLMFSATMPAEILSIASDFMSEYEIVEEETSEEDPVLTEQFFCVVREEDKTEVLVRIMDTTPDFYGLVFCQTKADAEAVSKELEERGFRAAALHGDVAQIQREKILSGFRKKHSRVLVATDVAARGIDIGGLTHVINYAVPYDGPTYTHRIGRTGRAGARGTAITFLRPGEQRRLKFLEKHARGELKEMKIPSVQEVLAAKSMQIENRLNAYLDKAVPALAEERSGVLSGSNGGKYRRFLEFAAKISEGRPAEDLVPALLAYQFGDVLSPSRYSSVRSAQPPKSDKNHIRLYISLGRRDGMTKRGIARFFHDLLKIPERLVDDIALTDGFSLVTLPADFAKAALDLSRKNRRVPHMHVDVKDAEGGRKSGNRRGGERREGRLREPPRSARPADKSGRSSAGSVKERASRRRTRTYSRGPKPDGT